MKLEKLKARLNTLFKFTDGPTGLYLSGGSDSLFLLNVLLDIGAEFSVVCFDHTFTRPQRDQIDEIVKQYGLRVFSYAPSNVYLIGNGKRVSMVEEYEMAGIGLRPFVRDAIHDTGRCAVEDVVIEGLHQGPAPIGFLLNIFGTRKGDRHYITGRPWKESYWRHNEFRYLAPLWEWTKKDIREGLDHYGVKPSTLDTGSFPMCLNCLCGKGKVHCPRANKEIDAINWDPNAMTEAFKTKYGFN